VESDPRAPRVADRALSTTSAAAIAALGLAIIVLMLLQAGVVRRGHDGHPTVPGPWPVGTGAPASPGVGVVTLPLAQNSWRAWRPSDLSTVNSFEHAIRTHVGVVMWYADWAHRQPLLGQLRAVGRRGSLPEITWEPWDTTRSVTEQPRYRLRRIIAGDYDPYIRRWARTIAAYGGRVRLRFAQEMNGRWYPWSATANGNRPGEFVRVWRHVHDLFVAAGATNVTWVWSPAPIAIPAALYPGDRYVDMVSLTVFNGGHELRYAPWRSFATALERPLARLRAIAPDKPIEISEAGCAEEGGSKASWIRGMFETLRRQPQITSLIWFELHKHSDWRVESSKASTAAFAEAVAALADR
jgi:beta-mannanase